MSPRVTVVVGGTSGIGLAAAQTLAAQGDELVLVARDGAAFDHARQVVKDAGGDAHCVAADVNSLDDVERLVAEVLDRHGRIDALVHTATVMAYGTIEQMPPEAFEAVVDTAIHGTANLARVALPVLQRPGHRPLPPSSPGCSTGPATTCRSRSARSTRSRSSATASCRGCSTSSSARCSASRA